MSFGFRDNTPKAEHQIQQDLEKEVTVVYDIKELHQPVTDFFKELGYYDVRFDFDSFSVDDCRCNVVSSRQVNVLCSLKHVPLRSIIIEEGDFPGRVKLKLKDDFVEK